MVSIREAVDTDSAGLIRLCNRALAPLPYAEPVSEDDLKEALRCGPRVTKEGQCGPLLDTKMLVGEADGDVRALCYFSVADMDVQMTGNTGPEGLIHFFAYEPGHGRLGQALLDECERRVSCRSARRMWAFHRFCVWRVHNGGLSQQWLHVLGLFRRNGYRAHSCGALCERRLDELSEPSPPDDAVETVVEAENSGEGGHDQWVRTYREGEQLACCYCLSRDVDWIPAWERNSVCIDWVEVEEAHRGKGWGHYVLEKSLWEMQQRGYTHSLVIDVDLANDAAMLLYSNAGYRVVDTSYVDLSKGL